jgi:hypothetical protein
VVAAREQRLLQTLGRVTLLLDRRFQSVAAAVAIYEPEVDPLKTVLVTGIIFPCG